MESESSTVANQQCSRRGQTYSSSSKQCSSTGSREFYSSTESSSTLEPCSRKGQAYLDQQQCSNARLFCHTTNLSSSSTSSTTTTTSETRSVLKETHYDHQHGDSLDCLSERSPRKSWQDSVSSTCSSLPSGDVLKDEWWDRMPADSSSGSLHRRTLSPDGGGGGLTKRSNKPLMEKRRRQKFNQILTELKRMVLEATKKDPSRYTKMEKVEILQMTLKYVQHLQKQETRFKNTLEDSTKFRAGFSHCTAEVSKVLGSEVSLDVQKRVISHLSMIGQSISTINNNNNTAFVQNKINIAPPQAPIIFVTVPNPQTIPILDGNSLGVTSQINVIPAMSTTNTISTPPTRIQIIPSIPQTTNTQFLQTSTENVSYSHSNNRNTVNHSSYNNLINNSSRLKSLSVESLASIKSCDERSKDYSNTNPILNSLLATDRIQHKRSPSSNSESSTMSKCYDSALGTDVTDISDSDSSSCMSSPVASPSCSDWRDAASPVYEVKPPDHKQKVSLSSFIANTRTKCRETLNPVSYGSKRPPLIAPKPSNSSSSVSRTSSVIVRDTSMNIKRSSSHGHNQDSSQAKMWRPW